MTKKHSNSEKIIADGALDSAYTNMHKSLKTATISHNPSIVDYLNTCCEHIKRIRDKLDIPHEDFYDMSSSNTAISKGILDVRVDSVQRLLNLHTLLSTVEDDLMSKAIQYGTPINLYERPRMPDALQAILENVSTNVNPAEIANVSLRTDAKTVI